jgi:CTP-dependent riboflavin kinase
MGAGGAAGAIIAAKQKRIQEAVDAFRLSDATAAARARRLEDIGVLHTGEVQDLIVEGVIVPGPGEGTYYLSEPGYIYQRDERKGIKIGLVLAVILLALGIALVASRVVPH